MNPHQEFAGKLKLKLSESSHLASIWSFWVTNPGKVFRYATIFGGGLDFGNKNDKEFGLKGKLGKNVELLN